MDKIVAATRTYTINRVAPIESEKFNAFTTHVASDMLRFSESINQIITIINSAGELPDASISIIENALDGKNIFVDVDATPGSFFYDDSLPDGIGNNGRPVTIMEALDAIYKVTSKSTQNVRQGAKIGDINSPVSIPGDTDYTVNWPYDDGVFVPFLFEGTNTIQQASSITVSLDVSYKNLTIHNDSSSTKNIWGYIWHPVFAF